MSVSSPVHHLEPPQDTRQRTGSVHQRSLNPQTLKLIVLVHLALVHRPIVLESLYVVHLIETFDFLRNRYTTGGHVRRKVGQRAHRTYLNELTVFGEEHRIGRRVFGEDLRLAELGLKALRKGADALVLKSTIDELFVLEKSYNTSLSFVFKAKCK